MIRIDRGKPRQANLRRAVSTVYYALFHCLAEDAANLLVGGQGSDRSKHAWRQAYRALEHGHTKSRCIDQRFIKKFPPEIEDFANQFVEMQIKRHDADYDPRSGPYYKSSVLQDIEDADVVIDRYGKSPKKDRRAFAVYVIMKTRFS
ncbi:MAG: hypothetical protein CMM78_06470 [Rhodospirillaceae bacterium]|uniref:hypothetical protein n=1 Tax=unclassified Hwanghaeella TaxID=2605944 RepID=UPI000C62CB1A|nr:hypothetical protein [Rhodospirillales bacterium]MAX47836.1 hypothetical protein [Rhodospirillaceae bacterium]